MPILLGTLEIALTKKFPGIALIISIFGLLNCSGGATETTTRSLVIKQKVKPVVSTDGIQLREFPCDLSANPNQDFSLAELTSIGKYSMSLLNGERAFFPKESGNATALEWSDALWKLAICHARDMCERDFFNHVNPDNADPFARVDSALGPVYTAYAENLSSSFNSALTYRDSAQREAAAKVRHLSYMDECVCNEGCSSKKEAGHRINVLNSTYTHVGIGTWYCKQNKKWYEAQNFWRLGQATKESNGYCANGMTANPPAIFSKYNK
jgi:uncharacterized protein YkwD